MVGLRLSPHHPDPGPLVRSVYLTHLIRPHFQGQGAAQELDLHEEAPLGNLREAPRETPWLGMAMSHLAARPVAVGILQHNHLTRRDHRPHQTSWLRFLVTTMGHCLCRTPSVSGRCQCWIQKLSTTNSASILWAEKLRCRLSSRLIPLARHPGRECKVLLSKTKKVQHMWSKDQACLSNETRTIAMAPGDQRGSPSGLFSPWRSIFEGLLPKSMRTCRSMAVHLPRSSTSLCRSLWHIPRSKRDTHQDESGTSCRTCSLPALPSSGILLETRKSEVQLLKS
mmetsp:Transcript_44260/g.95324  ORF Transcript_44260/g.95324 Transcript_44260/m.95324 type:complete len:282 (-) Transcript_44260:302-1147(-)